MVVTSLRFVVLSAIVLGAYQVALALSVYRWCQRSDVGPTAVPLGEALGVPSVAGQQLAVSETSFDRVAGRSVEYAQS